MIRTTAGSPSPFLVKQTRLVVWLGVDSVPRQELAEAALPGGVAHFIQVPEQRVGLVLGLQQRQGTSSKQRGSHVTP